MFFLILIALLMLKLILFMDITNIQYVRGLTFTTSGLIILFIFSMLYFSKIEKKRVIGLVVYGIISLIMFIDIMYFTYFNTLPSVGLLSILDEAGAVGESVKDLFTFKNALFILDLPFLILYMIKSKDEVIEYDIKVRRGIPMALGISIIFMLSYLQYNDLMITVSSQELFTYHIRDIKDVVKGEDDQVFGNSLFTEDDINELKERSKLIGGEFTGIGQGKNLIVIQVEALQNFTINRFYEGQEITPNLNSLIKDSGSMYFDNYYQQLGRGNTADAEFVTNNSLYPSDENCVYKEYGDNTFYGLPWILRDNGYKSWVFHGYEKEFWNRENAYVNQGFERFLSQDDYEFTEDETSGFGVIDEVFYDQTLEYIDEMDKSHDGPFHAFIISLTSHTPFNISEDLQSLEIGQEYQGTILGNYLQAVHYADKALGEFIENLKKKGYYDNSVIAIYGDHFGIKAGSDPEMKFMKEFLGKPYDFDEMMHIPLIVHVPGLSGVHTISKIGSQLDFLPTILNLMGYENKKGLMFGRDLINYEGYNYVAPMTYLVKGSFIDENVMFQMSRDGIFNNSRAKYRDTRKQIMDLEPLRNSYEIAIDEINKSKYVLNTDLIKSLLENEGQIDLESIQVDNILEGQSIISCYTDTMEQLEEAKNSGNKIMSVIVQYSRNDIVLGDGTDIDELVQWMEDNEGIYVTLRTYEEDERIFLDIKDKYPELMDRFIVEMTDFEHYLKLSNNAYEYIILNLSDTSYSEEEVEEFLERTPVSGVIIDGVLTVP